MLCPPTSDKSGAVSARGLCNLATAEERFAVATQLTAQGYRRTNIPYLQQLLPPPKNNTIFGTHRGRRGRITRVLRDTYVRIRARTSPSS